MSKHKPMTLEEVLDQAQSTWSGDTGLRRRDDVAALIESVCAEYSEALGMTREQVFESIEAVRDYCPVNYYQRANFPKLAGVTIYNDPEHFQSVVGDRGFRCPRCKGVSKNPFECESGADMSPGKRCDWKSYGLFGCLNGGHQALMRSAFPGQLRPVLMFRPVALEVASVSSAV